MIVTLFAALLTGGATPVSAQDGQTDLNGGTGHDLTSSPKLLLAVHRVKRPHPRDRHRKLLALTRPKIDRERSHLE